MFSVKHTDLIVSEEVHSRPTVHAAAWSPAPEGVSGGVLCPPQHESFSSDPLPGESWVGTVNVCCVSHCHPQHINPELRDAPVMMVATVFRMTVIHETMGKKRRVLRWMFGSQAGGRGGAPRRRALCDSSALVSGL